jgi:hypothetical protein
MTFWLAKSQGIGVSAESNSSVTLAMQRADANGCPFYCMKIVISLVKGEL